MQSVVLFINKMPLYLTEVKRDEHGNVKSGYVVNGAWNYSATQVDSSTMKILNRDDLVPKTNIVEVEVPSSKSSERLKSYNYNDVIFWAEEQLNGKSQSIN